MESTSEVGQDERWRSRASFRIFGETLHPEELGATLGVSATKTHVKGQRHSGGRGIWRESAWLLSSPLEKDNNLAEHLKWLLDRLEPKADVVKVLVDKYRVDIFCGFSSGSGQGGFTIDATTLGRLARLGVPLGLDLYPPEAFGSEGAQQYSSVVVP